jgi:hypothetical protein
MVGWLHYFWVWGKAVHQSRRTGWGRDAHLIAARKQRVLGRDWGQGIPFKGMSPVTYFLQLDPIFHFSAASQKFTQLCQWINKIIYKI